jgi:FkbM family methyltransferase
LNHIEIIERAIVRFIEAGRQYPTWENRRILIYGLGRFGRELYGIIDGNKGCRIIGMMDRNKLDGPDLGELIKEQPIVVIGVFNYKDSLKEIRDHLVALGFKTIITPMEAYLHLTAQLGSRFWMGCPKDYADALEQIEKAIGLFADEESKRLFVETLLFRLNFDLDMAIVKPDHAPHYCPADLPRWKSPMHLIDGGAFDGDSLEAFSGEYEFATVNAFEPDSENFEKLSDRAAGLFPADSFPGMASLWPCGLWSLSSQLTFHQNGMENSSIAAGALSIIQAVALDDVLLNHPVTLIKLDVEGAEMMALTGAKRLIERNRPGLAVCLYHRPSDLWSIPQWVSDLSLDYKLYYRIHGQNTFDGVLYAFPQ